MLLWTKNAQLTVRSAYYVALEASMPSEFQNNSESYWAGIWNLNIIPKVKISLWRIGHQSLPTLDNLIRRGIEVTNICPVCGAEPENQAHLFMSCSWAVKLWICFFPDLNPLSFVNENMISWYFRIKSLLGLANWSLFNTLLWCIWKNRNLAVFQGQCWLPAFALLFAKQLSMDFYFAASLHESISPARGWQKPSGNFIKVNSDAAFFSTFRKIGIGIVARNSYGNVLKCKSVFIDGNSDIMKAEAMSLVLAAKMAKEAGYKEVIFESDSLILIQEINSHRPSYLSCRNFVTELKDLSSSFDSCFFVFASRDCNRLAHSLANLKTNEYGRLPLSLTHVASSDMKC